MDGKNIRRRGPIFLLGILLCVAAPAARAAHVGFAFQSSDTTAQALRSVSLYPSGTFTNGNGVIITRDRVTGLTDSTGALTISNVYGGVYRGELQGTFTVTTNWYNFPVTNGVIRAADYITAPTNVPGTGTAYTIAESDSTFVARLGGHSTNLSLYGGSTLRSGAYLNAGQQQIFPSGGPGGGGISIVDGDLGGTAAIEGGSYYGVSSTNSGAAQFGFVYSTNGLTIKSERYTVTVGTNSATSNIFVDLAIGHQNGQSRGGISFSDSPMDSAYGGFFMVPDHDVPGSPSPANSEMQIQFPHRIAITTAYGSGVGAPLQWGANNAPMWEFNQNQLNITPANTLGFSGPKMWQAYVSDGAGAGARSYEVYPGLISGGYTFNGLGGNVGGWEFDVFSDSLDTSSLGLLGTWRGTTAARANLVHGLQVYDTTNHLYKGTAIKGAVRLEKTAASATGLTGIDFGSASCRDLSASGNSVTFFTTNVVSGSTNFQKLSCILRANGFAPTLAYPAWCTNAPLPSSLTANQMLLLNLQAVGTGETNILVESSSVLLDQTFGYDQAVTDFMFRSGLSSLSISNALNTFVKRLKVDSTWSQLDALYPFAGTTAAQNKWNLANTNLYTITFSGTITHGNGILGNGSTGFGDTGWTPSQNDTLVFAWCSNFTASTFLYVLGSQNVSGNGSAIRDGGSVAGLQTGANISIGNLNTTDVATPAMPNGFAASRSGSGSFNVYFGYSGLSSPSIASASPSGATVYVLARNNNGSADQFWDKTVQVVALGRNISQSQYQTLYSATTNLNAALGR